MTARQLADELGVSQRTIYRDVDALQAVGVPLYGDAGHAGGFALVDGYRTRLTGLTGEEAEALSLTGVPGPASDLGLGPVVAAVELKLRAALPTELRDRYGRIRERFHLDAPGWYQDGDTTPHVAAVADSVWRQQTIRVFYRSWTGITVAVLRPYGVVLKTGKWYMVAHTGHDIRTYRINQILDLQILDQPFDRPEDFDLAGYWKAKVREFRRRLYQGQAVIRVSPQGQERLPDLLASPVVDAFHATASPPDAAGWTTATVPIESVTHATTELLKLGADVEVLEPRALRARLVTETRRLAALYVEDPSWPATV